MSVLKNTQSKVCYSWRKRCCQRHRVGVFLTARDILEFAFMAKLSCHANEWCIKSSHGCGGALCIGAYLIVLYSRLAGGCCSASFFISRCLHASLAVHEQHLSRLTGSHLKFRVLLCNRVTPSQNTEWKIFQCLGLELRTKMLACVSRVVDCTVVSYILIIQNCCI